MPSEKRRMPKEMQRTKDERVMERSATLVCFSVQGEKFDSASERNKFFRGLYGWTQTVKTEDAGGHEKEYTYERHGVLDRVPHKRVDQSSIIIDEDRTDDVFKFFRGWANKVMWRTFRVMLDEEDELEEGEEEEALE